jgi:hypothetical protein
MPMRKFLVLVLVAALLSPVSANAADCRWDQSAGWVARENLKKGDKNWSAEVPLRYSADFSRRKDVPRIEGYLSLSSATCGEKLTLTTVGSKKFTASIYRMGYYNNHGARLVKLLKSPTHISIDAKTPPGQYLIKLSNNFRAATFVPFLVYGDAPSEATFISSVLTWQSYNQWGGQSLYKGADGARETASKVVTFDRPYDGDGSGQFRYMEQPVVTMMEKIGIDINYVTDLEVHNNPVVFEKTKSIIVGGHSEYWTIAMRDSIESAVGQGKNLVVFGGNTAYAVTEINDRNISGRTPYRDILRPESTLLGSQYFALGIRKDLISNNLWPFTGLGQDAVIKGIYGYEADTSLGTIGPGVQVSARAAISPTEKGYVAMSTYYTAPSGASVLNMGTNGWVCAINNRCPWGHTFEPDTQKQIQKVTAEVLKSVKTSKWPVAQIDFPARP